MEKDQRNKLKKSLQKKALEHFRSGKLGFILTNAQLKSAAKRHVDILFSQLRAKEMI